MRVLTVVMAACLLSACALVPPPPVSLEPMARRAADSRSVEVLVATSRVRASGPYAFTNERSSFVNYQAVELEVPADRQAAGANVDFPALRNEAINDVEFAQRVNAAAVAGGGEVTVFVHGFNTPHERAILRLGQVAVDAGALGAKVLFSWPSRGRVLDYLTDRESTLHSRDQLGAVLKLLARQPGVKRINLLAHSMGAFLSMETLRSAKLAGDGEFGGKLNAVVLAAPDIDLDVFHAQLEIIGRRARPTIVLISRDDSALSLSRSIAGDVQRVGVVDVSNPVSAAAIRRFGHIVIDLTRVRAESHQKFAQAPGIIRYVGDLVGNGGAATPGVRQADESGNVIVELNTTR